MNTPPKYLSVLVIVMFAHCLVTNGQDQPVKPSEQKIPRIQMQRVPLGDAIKNLGEQAELSFMVDPKITNSARTNKSLRSPVTIRWENLSAKEALVRLLKDRGLFMVENPQTGVTKITTTNSLPKVFDKEFLSTTKEIIEVVRMDGVPLERSFELLQEKGVWKLDLDGKSLARSKNDTEEIFVSVNLKNLTACQALAGVCELYDLQIVKSQTAGTWRILRENN